MQQIPIATGFFIRFLQVICFYFRIHCSFMNITMVNVVFVDQRGKMRPLDNFFVLARNVKYIHIPKEVISVLVNFLLTV